MDIKSNIKINFQQIFEYAEKTLSNTSGSHDLEHTKRVHNLCIYLGKKQNADLEILKAAALLHDIARPLENKFKGKICHAQKGAEISKIFLKKLKIPEEKINKIVHCIETHRFRKNNAPKSIEAKILFDADKLDAIGAIGLARAFVFAGENKAKVHNTYNEAINGKAYSEDDTAFKEFLVKLSKIKNKMFTKQGKRLAQKRHKFMIKFFKTLNKEVYKKF